MPPILSGSFRHFPARELFSLLTRYEHSGTLDITGTLGQTSVLFDHGTITGAQTSLRGLSDPKAIVLNLFSWMNGEFSFTDNDPIGTVSIDYATLAEEGERRAAELDEMRRLYPNEDVMVRAVEKPAGGSMIQLTSDQLRLLLLTASGSPLTALASEFSRPVEAYRHVHALEAAGLLRVDGEQEETEPDTPRTFIGALVADKPGGGVFPLLDNVSTVGRDAKNAIVIADGSVSSKHARITLTADGFAIEDLGSRNGTFVNGERVTARRVLVKKDVVRFGKVIMTFNLAEEENGMATTKTRKIS